MKAVALALLLLLVSMPTTAQTACAPRDEMIRYLERQYQETPAAVAVTGAGAAMEILTSDNGSWTMIITNPSGVSCLVMVGNGWTTMPRKATL